MGDLIEVLFNEKSDKFSVWLNGKVVKLTTKKSTADKFAKSLRTR